MIHNDIKTKVVCLKRNKDVIIQDCDVYIGRQIPRGGWSFNKSIFANPYIVGNSFFAKHSGEYIKITSVKQSIIRYWNMIVQGKVDIKTYDEICLIRKAIKNLKGKTLGCFCKKKGDELCHGDILAYIADNWEGKIDEEGRMILDLYLEKMSLSLKKLFESEINKT
jgi:hypothetical protein